MKREDLIERRKRAGLSSLVDAQHATGIDKNRLNRLERHGPDEMKLTVREASALAQAYGCTVRDILGEDLPGITAPVIVQGKPEITARAVALVQALDALPRPVKAGIETMLGIRTDTPNTEIDPAVTEAMKRPDVARAVRSFLIASGDIPLPANEANRHSQIADESGAAGVRPGTKRQRRAG